MNIRVMVESRFEVQCEVCLLSKSLDNRNDFWVPKTTMIGFFAPELSHHPRRKFGDTVKLRHSSSHTHKRTRTRPGLATTAIGKPFFFLVFFSSDNNNDDNDDSNSKDQARSGHRSDADKAKDLAKGAVPSCPRRPMCGSSPARWNWR